MRTTGGGAFFFVSIHHYVTTTTTTTTTTLLALIFRKEDICVKYKLKLDGCWLPKLTRELTRLGSQITFLIVYGVIKRYWKDKHKRQYNSKFKNRSYFVKCYKGIKKKFPDFSCTRGRTCVYGRYAPATCKIYLP